MESENSLYEKWKVLVSKYCKDDAQIEKEWKQIKQVHSESHRYYHGMQHLHHLFTRLQQVADKAEDPESLYLAMFFHDIVYDPQRKDNEEESAEVARTTLVQLGFPEDKIYTCIKHILATKGIKYLNHNDSKYFVDADLSILGEAPEVYRKYAEEIRKEYSFYPDFLYKPGRKNILNHFLNMSPLYKTDYFREQYESQARKNLEQELESL